MDKFWLLLFHLSPLLTSFFSSTGFFSCGFFFLFVFSSLLLLLLPVKSLSCRLLFTKGDQIARLRYIHSNDGNYDDDNDNNNKQSKLSAGRTCLFVPTSGWCRCVLLVALNLFKSSVTNYLTRCHLESMTTFVCISVCLSSSQI